MARGNQGINDQLFRSAEETPRRTGRRRRKSGGGRSAAGLFWYASRWRSGWGSISWAGTAKEKRSA